VPDLSAADHCPLTHGILWQVWRGYVGVRRERGMAERGGVRQPMTDETNIRETVNSDDDPDATYYVPANSGVVVIRADD